MRIDFFSAAPRPPSEAERQAEVARYPDTAFEDAEIGEIVAEAQALCGTEIAALSIIDGDRQRLFGVRGSDLTETSRATAICAYTILSPGKASCHDDLAADPRFAANPFVAPGGTIRFYAGAAVCAANGAALGALCAMDPLARPALTPDKGERLQALAERAAAVLARHRRHG